MSGINGFPENPAPHPSPAAVPPANPAVNPPGPPVNGHTNGVDVQDFGDFGQVVQENQMDRSTLRDCLLDLQNANEEGFTYWQGSQLRQYVANSDNQPDGALLPLVMTLVNQALTTHLGENVTAVRTRNLGEGTPDSPSRIIFEVVCPTMELDVPAELLLLANIVYVPIPIDLGTEMTI